MAAFGFHFDMRICTGCKTCMLACKDKNDLGPGVRWRRVVEYAGGNWFPLPDGTFNQDVFAYYISVSCNHCEEAICVEVCPTGAMHKDETGIVKVDAAKCLGCRYCEWACPYSAPQYDPIQKRMTKCDCCADRLEAGLEPACVAACPTRALTFAPLSKSGEKDGPGANPAPLPSIRLTGPNWELKPHKKAEHTNHARGGIINPEEIKDA